mgnify:CR=1 FL=1
MNITKDSDKILSFLVKDDNINYKYHKPIGKSKHIFKVLYNKLSKAATLIKEIGTSEVTKITNSGQIVKPRDYDTRSFPAKILQHIDQHSKTQYLYTVNSNTSPSLFSRTIKVFFVDEHNDTNINKNKYADCFRKMLYWFYILNSCASSTCSQTITIYIYLSSVKKELPEHSSIIIDQNHANTGFTRNCTVNSEICIFRKEEWFKVFIHETFHNFGLDFSDMNLSSINRYIREIFNVNIEYNIYESYCEVWARIMNTMIYSYLSLSNKHRSHPETFRNTFKDNMKIEAYHSLYQSLKILTFMDLNFKVITEKSKDNIEICNHLYREKTSVFSYYIITSLLMNNYINFLGWCSKNNNVLLQFKKTPGNLDKYIEFIKDCCKNL